MRERYHLSSRMEMSCLNFKCYGVFSRSSFRRKISAMDRRARCIKTRPGKTWLLHIGAGDQSARGRSHSKRAMKGRESRAPSIWAARYIVRSPASLNTRFTPSTNPAATLYLPEKL